MAALEEDVALVRRWFQHLQICVQMVDFAGARPLFAEDVVAFGSVTPVSIGRGATEEEQWRTVWGYIDGFRWRLDDLRAMVSGDRCTAVGMALFDSTGYTELGRPYERPGRATVVLGRAGIGEEWIARHIHVSLFRDVPARSFGRKPERAARA
jgi:ketosteroid isomerase-like protein